MVIAKYWNSYVRDRQPIPTRRDGTDRSDDFRTFEVDGTGIKVFDCTEEGKHTFHIMSCKSYDIVQRGKQQLIFAHTSTITFIYEIISGSLDVPPPEEDIWL